MNDLYVGGASGTGQYVPLLALKIMQNRTENQINLQVKIIVLLKMHINIIFLWQKYEWIFSFLINFLKTPLNYV